MSVSKITFDSDPPLKFDPDELQASDGYTRVAAVAMPLSKSSFLVKCIVLSLLYKL
jgi:hypothetical protein